MLYVRGLQPDPSMTGMQQYQYIHLSDNVRELLRSVEHQSVPLALDVVVLGLLSDIDTIKLQLSGQLLLSLEDNQRDLKGIERESA